MRRTLNFVVMAVMAQFMVLYIAKLVSQGFSWSAVIWIHLYLIGITIALVWEFHGRHSSPLKALDAAPQPAPRATDAPTLWSLVLLLREGGPLEAVDLRRRLGRVFNRSVGQLQSDANYLRPGDDVAFVFRIHEQRMAILSERTPYVKDREAEATMASSKELAAAILQHHAWRAVDWLDGASPDRQGVYAILGRTVVELALDAEPLALFCPETGQMTPWTDAVAGALRDGDVARAFPDGQSVGAAV